MSIYILQQLISYPYIKKGRSPPLQTTDPFVEIEDTYWIRCPSLSMIQTGKKKTCVDMEERRLLWWYKLNTLQAKWYAFSPWLQKAHVCLKMGTPGQVWKRPKNCVSMSKEQYDFYILHSWCAYIGLFLFCCYKIAKNYKNIFKINYHIKLLNYQQEI